MTTCPERRFRLAVYTDATAIGGAEISLGNLLGELPPTIEVIVTGTTPSVVSAVAARRPEARTETVPPVTSKFDVAAIVAHLKLFRALRPEICHVNLRTPYSCQYGLAAALVTPGVRVIAVEHLPLHADSPLSRWFKRRTSSGLAAHVSVGERSARLVEEDAGLRRGSIRVIRNGVRPPDAQRPQRPATGAIVGSLGRLERQKGYDVLVDALVELPDVTGVIVGEGPERTALRRRATERGVGDRFILLGWLADARRYLPTFDVFVLTSRFEGFPLVVIEAMLAGCPVVATAVGSVDEAVVDGSTGILVPPDDPGALAGALRRVLEDGELARRLGDAGRSSATASFSAGAMARAYLELYDELLWSRGRRGSFVARAKRRDRRG